MQKETKLNKLIIEKLNQLGLTISTCESITGGALAASLVQVEHASNSFQGSLVTYATDSKNKLAKVDKEVLDTYGAVSSQCARQMASGCVDQFKTDIGVSTTGNASSSNPMENKPSGMAYVCIKLFDKYYDYQFNASYTDRIDVINECVAFALFNIWQLIKDLKK